MNWKIGDRAIICGLAVDAQYNGTEVIITSSLRKHRESGDMVHNVDIEMRGRPACIEPQYLKPIPDTYDGNEVTTWDECVWQPGVTA